MEFKNALYIVSTPIGNILDITIHALECLKSADFILCEDTRKTGFLLKQHNIPEKKLLIYNEHSSVADVARFVELAKQYIVALVSDAGTPLICDPGYSLVHYARNNKVGVFILPGSCALIASATLCGININNMLFLGFFQKGMKFQAEFANALYVAPHDIIVFLKALCKYEIFFNINLSIAREVTKLFQEVLFFSDTSSAIHFFNENPPIGEFTIFVKFCQKKVDIDVELKLVLKELHEWQSLPLKSLAKFIHNYCLKFYSQKEIYNKLALFKKEIE
jgi:16S rRNA (cytidine1402-2'-O)-methyltransferase